MKNHSSLLLRSLLLLCLSTLTAWASVNIDPPTRTFTKDGGGGSILTSGSGTWTANANVPWLTITPRVSGNAGESCIYVVSSNFSADTRQGTITINDKVHTITQTGYNATLSPITASYALAGGTGSINVTTDAGVSWTAVSNASWITVNSVSGISSGSVSYSVVAYSGVSTRSGTMTIAGKTFTVSQTGADVNISPYEVAKAYSSDIVQVQVTALSTTAWAVTSMATWISVVDAGNGFGDSTITLAIGTNPSYDERIGLVAIGSATFTIRQAGVPNPVLAINPPSADADPVGAVGNVAVSATPNAPWTAQSLDPWIVIASGASGTGNGNIQYVVSANPTLQPRSGRIRITPPPPALPTVDLSRGLVAVFDGIYNYARDDNNLTGNVAYPIFNGTVSVSLNNSPAERDVDDFAFSFVFSHSNAGALHRLFDYQNGTQDLALWVNTSGQPVLRANGTTATASGITVNVNTNYQVIVQGSAAKVELWISPEGSTPVNRATVNLTQPSLGRNHFQNLQFGRSNFPTPGFFTGSLRLVAMHCRMLNETEIAGYPFDIPGLKSTPIKENGTFQDGITRWISEGNILRFQIDSPGIVELATGGSGFSYSASAYTTPRKLVTNSVTFSATTSTFGEYDVGDFNYILGWGDISPELVLFAQGGQTEMTAKEATLAFQPRYNIALPGVRLTRGYGWSNLYMESFNMLEDALNSQFPELQSHFQSNLSRNITARHAFDFSGSTIDSTQHTVAKSSVPRLTSDRWGRESAAVSWNSTDQVEVVPVDYIRSASLWIYTNSLSSSQPVLRVEGSADANAWQTRTGLDQFVISTEASGKLKISLGLDSFETISCISPQAWHKVTWVRMDTGNVRIYCDGVEVGETTEFISQMGDPEWHPIFFRIPGFEGKVDDFALYNEALTTSEIVSLYDQQKVTTVIHTINQGIVQGSLSPAAASVPVGGGSSLTNLTIANNVNWTASTSAPWITILSPLTGAGSAQLQVEATANPTVYPRHGIVSIAGIDFTITQAGRNASVSTTVATVGTDGGSAFIDVTTEAGSQWTATSEVPWLTIAIGETGVGNGYVLFVADPYTQTSLTRTGTLNIAGHTIYVTQRGYELTVSPMVAEIGSNASEGEFGVSAPLSAIWEAIVTEPWITLIGSTSGIGNGTLRYSVADNTTGQTRTGRIIVSGVEYTVTQATSLFLTTSSSGGGSVSSGGPYSKNAVATITASPETGFVFSHWTGDAAGSANPLQLDMDTSKTVAANFIPTAAADSIAATAIQEVINDPNTYGLYTPDQMRGLALGSPVLERDPETGKFRLKLGVQKSTNLNQWQSLPIAGVDVSVDKDNIQVEFTSPDGAAFFRVEGNE